MTSAARALGQLGANEFLRLVLLWTDNKDHNYALYACIEDMTALETSCSLSDDAVPATASLGFH